jgi:hypothetical protein
MDKHYWKNAYKDFWEVAASKENKIKNIIENETGFKVLEIGLGAGSTEFVSGNASDNKLTKGDADLYVNEKECFVEVTGPNIKMDFNRPLWVRPDKLRNAYNKIQKGEGKLHVIVHVLIQLITKKSFNKVTPFIRGREETYYELPPEHETIISLEDFISKLKEI